jgi:hypothetical protein
LLGCSESTGYDEDIERRAVSERLRREDAHARRGSYGFEILPDEVHLGVRHAMQELERAREVELSETRKEQHSDVEGHAAILPHGFMAAVTKNI